MEGSPINHNEIKSFLKTIKYEDQSPAFIEWLISQVEKDSALVVAKACGKGIVIITLKQANLCYIWLKKEVHQIEKWITIYPFSLSIKNT